MIKRYGGLLGSGVVCLVSMAALIAACSSSDKAGIISDDPNLGGSGGGGGRLNRAGAAGKTDVGEGGEAGATGEADPLVPLVTIISPVQVTDPNVGPVVLDAVHVECTATKGPSPAATFAASTVAIEAFDADGKSLKKASGTQSLDDSSLFFADFQLSSAVVPNGAVSFKCSASDTSNPVLTGGDIVNTFIDHGPTITALSPLLPDKNLLNYFALGVVPFKFTVTPAPLKAGDKQAEVDEVTLTVNSVPIALDKAEDPANPGTYLVEANLADGQVFKMVPNDATSVAITATNKRAPLPVNHPDPVKASLNYNFGIDGAGPKITITSPSVLNAPVLGRQVKLEFTIVDSQSKVDPSTVTVRLNSGEPQVFNEDSWGHTGDNYTYTITDTTAIQGSTFQLSVRIDASDFAKNKALSTTAQYWLDTNPPIVDLDPPKIVEVKNGQCSVPFDPLGPKSPNDTQTISSAEIFRALVWDQTNGVGVAPVLHYSGVEPLSVRLYAQPVTTQPFLIAAHNTTGLCDEIAIEGTAGVTSPPVPTQLGGLQLAGSAFYGSMGAEVAANIPGTCSPGTGVTPPNYLCSAQNSDMRRVINHNLDVNENVIYALSSSNALECTGKVLEIGASLPNGWVCLAARAVDNAGNVGISAPIRVCLNNAQKPEPACANSSTVMPTCVTACTPPGHFKGQNAASSIPYVITAP